MRHNIANIISVIYSLIKFSIMKLFYFKAFSFHLIERVSPNVVFTLTRDSKLKMGKRVRIHSKTRLAAVSGGELIIEDDCKFSYNALVVCRDKIHLKKGAEIGPNVLIYDHDHDFRMKGGVKSKKFRSAPVVIGENTWVCGNSVILAGSTIGKNCVIAAGSVVKGNVPDNTIFVQKKTTDLIPIKMVDSETETDDRHE